MLYPDYSRSNGLVLDCVLINPKTQPPKVALNGEDDYAGGRLVFATEAGLLLPSRY